MNKVKSILHPDVRKETGIQLISSALEFII